MSTNIVFFFRKGKKKKSTFVATFAACKRWAFRNLSVATFCVEFSRETSSTTLYIKDRRRTRPHEGPNPWCSGLAREIKSHLVHSKKKGLGTWAHPPPLSPGEVCVGKPAQPSPDSYVTGPGPRLLSANPVRPINQVQRHLPTTTGPGRRAKSHSSSVSAQTSRVGIVSPRTQEKTQPLSTLVSSLENPERNWHYPPSNRPLPVGGVWNHHPSGPLTFFWHYMHKSRLILNPKGCRSRTRKESLSGGEISIEQSKMTI